MSRTLAALLASALAGPATAADMRTISHGERVDLSDHKVFGKYVVFDFYADWCGPCQKLAPALRDLADANPERLAVRKIDIRRWDSPVAQQHAVQSIPFLVLYSPAGEQLAAGNARIVMRRLEAALRGSAAAAAAQPAGGSPTAPAPDAARTVAAVVTVAVMATAATLFFRTARSRRQRPRPRAAAPRPAPAAEGARTTPNRAPVPPVIARP